MPSTHLIVSNPWKDKENTSIEQKLMAEDTNYTSPSFFEEVAEKELRENEHTRKQCLEHFKDWIKKNQDIENCFIDDGFLLRFLRVKKFSIPMAEQTLLKYLNFRKRFKDFMYNLDYQQCPLLSNGYIVVSPYRDSNGRRVIIYNLKRVNPHDITGKDICLAHAITYETLLAEEENQIMGFNHIGDTEGLSPAFLTLWSVSEFATIIRWGEQSMPMRHKEVNLLNFPSSFKYVYDFIRSNIKSQKLKDRISIHNSLSDLHKKVNKKCLPSELGGSMPLKDMLDLWRKELAAKRDLLLSYDVMNLLSDRGIICKRNAPTEDMEMGSLSGSFRKLEVD